MFSSAFTRLRGRGLNWIPPPVSKRRAARGRMRGVERKMETQAEAPPLARLVEQRAPHVPSANLEEYDEEYDEEIKMYY